MIAYTAPGTKDIDEVICEVFAIDRDQLYTKTRLRPVVEARQLAMFIRKNNQHLTNHEAGKIYNRDKATVIWSVKQVEWLSEHDKRFQQKLKSVMSMLTVTGINGIRRNIPASVELDNISMYR